MIKLEDLTIKLKTNFNIDDSDAVEELLSKGYSQEDMMSSALDACEGDIDEQLVEASHEIQQLYHYNITRFDTIIRSISEFYISAEIDDTEYDSPEQAKDEFIKRVIEVLTSGYYTGDTTFFGEFDDVIPVSMTLEEIESEA